MKQTMADLVDRYLHSVRITLPGEQREDILAELRQDIDSQLEEREQELGWTLSEDDIAAILKKRGHPSFVASRYVPQRYLIGPAMYPIYVFVLKLVLLWVIIPGFALTAPIVYATSGNSAMLAVLTKLPTALFSAFGIITLIFVACERSWVAGIHAAWADWDPRKLPPVPVFPPPDRLPRSAAVGELISGVFWAGVWIYVASHGFSVNFSGVHCSFPRIWREVFWPELGLLLAWTVLAGIVVFKPEHVRLYAIARIVIDCGCTIVTAVLFFAGGAAVAISGPQLPAEALARAQYGVALGLRITWISVIVLFLIDMLVQIARLRRSRSKPAWEMNSALGR